MDRGSRKISSMLIAMIAAVILVSPKAARAEDQIDPYALPKECPVSEGFVNVTGGRVWYQIVGTGNATPLLTLHGGPGFGHDYLQPLGRLCTERPVIFYD